MISRSPGFTATLMMSPRSTPDWRKFTVSEKTMSLAVGTISQSTISFVKVVPVSTTVCETTEVMG